MYQVRNADTDDLVVEADDRDAVLDQLDNECRRLHDQANANPDAPIGTYRFDVMNHEGRAIAWLTYSPNTTRPYVSVLADEMLTRDRS